MAIKDYMEDVQETVINELITENGITNTLADGQVTPAKLDRDYLESSGGNVSGSVGIGTTSPTAPLTIKAPESGAEALHIYGRSDDIGQLVFLEADTTTKIGRLDARNGFFSVGTLGNIPLTFITGTTERMRIDSNGCVSIGAGSITNLGGTNNKVNINYDTTPGYHIVFNDTRSDGLAGAGALHFLRNAIGVGSVTTSTSSTSYNTSSDYRLKEDIIEMDDSLERLKALKPCNFAWKADGTRVDGFIAHEAQEVVPEAVTGTKDAMTTEEYEVVPAVLDEDGNEVTPAEMGTREVPDYQGIDQSKLVPLLTKALQEALTKIESLEARVASLENT